METARDETPEEGEEPKPIDEIVGGVLSEYSSSSKFLENMGIRSARSQLISTNTSSARRSRMLKGMNKICVLLLSLNSKK